MSKIKMAHLSEGKTVENERKSQEKPSSPSLSLIDPRLHPHFCFDIFTFAIFTYRHFVLLTKVGFTVRSCLVSEPEHEFRFGSCVLVYEVILIVFPSLIVLIEIVHLILNSLYELIE
jgi:hypothetical protein